MKKVMTGIVTSMLLVCMAIGLTGCEKSQIQAVAQQTGLFSAVGWIAMDNPSVDQIEAVKSILVVIEEKGADVEGGATYTVVLYPEIEKVIEKDLEPQYRPLAKAASIALLGSLDMLFAANPEWKESQDTAIAVVDSFIVGAKAGLSLSEKDAIMVQARSMATKRARVLK